MRMAGILSCTSSKAVRREPWMAGGQRDKQTEHRRERAASEAETFQAASLDGK